VSNKIYPISPAKIGNQDGFRLPRAFSREHPQLVNACGEVEVLDHNTLLIRLAPSPLDTEDEDDEESLVMGLFLDFLMKTVINQPETLVPYTEVMSAEIDQLLAGVTVE
jgi:antitoxin PrlF